PRTRSITTIYFFQAEDGIRDKLVTGVQTCALPIYPERHRVLRPVDGDGLTVEEDLAGVGRMDAGDAFDQRRLAGAVVADESHHRSEERRVGKEGRWLLTA